MDRTSKYRDLSKNALLFTISSFGSKIISFLLVPLYTYVLSTEDYGTADVVTTTVQLLIPVLTLNIQDGILRFSLDKEYDSDDVINSGIKVNLISGAILATILFVLTQLHIVLLDSKYIYFLFFSYFFGALNNAFSMYLKSVDRVKILTIAGLLNTFLSCLLNIILLSVIKIGVTGYLIANVAGTVLAVSYIFFAGNIYKSIRKSDNIILLKSMISYSLPLVVNSVAWWLNNASDRYILTFFCGTAINGVYAVSYKIPTILSTLQSVFYNAWSISAITEFDKEDKDGFIGNTYTMYSCASIIGCSMLLIGNIFIAKILYAKEFFEAWQYVPPLLVGTVFNGLALFEGCIFTAVKRTKDVSKTTILAALINTSLNFVLIPLIGTLGAAIATMIGYFCVWIIRTYQLRKIIKMKVNWKTQIVTIVLLTIQLFISLPGGHYVIQVGILLCLLCCYRKYMYSIYAVLKTKMFRK